MTEPYDDHDVRALLEDAVDDVQPRPGLDAIRARTAHRPARRGWAWAAGGAVLATAATVAAVTVLPSSGPVRPTRSVAAGPTSAAPTVPSAPATTATAPPAAPSATATPTGTRSAAPVQPTAPTALPTTVKQPAVVAPAATRVPVYFLGDAAGGQRLFPETQVLRDSDPVTEAVARAVTGQALDPDYRSPWPDGTQVRQAAASGGELTVDLTGPVAERPAAMTAEQAALAVQQLVWTAQAAARTADPVRFRLDGRPTATLLGQDTSGPVPAAPEDGTLTPVTVTSPGDGETVPRTFTVRGRAAAFEANVQWELLRGGTVVRRGFTTAAECCTLSPYSFQVSAPAGSYTLVVHDEDVSGEGVPASRDTKRITVG